MKKIKQPLPISNEIISVQELKFLVASIIHKKANIRIKCLTDGGIWTTQFYSVMMVTESGVILNDEVTDKIKSIRFIDQVIQFVLDRPFDNYNSNLTYLVH